MIRLTVSLLLVVTLLAAATADDKKTKDLILGKWESQDGLSKGVVVEFKEGTTTATFKGRAMSTGKYKFVEDDVMEFEPTFVGGGKKRVTSFRIKIMGDELTQTDLNTKIEKHLKRVK
jgi:hypothetical protein